MSKFKFSIFTALLFIISIGFSQSNDVIKSTLYKLDQLIYDIDKMYVDDVNKEILSNNLIIGMSNQTSTYSGYQKDSIIDSFDMLKQNKIESIGIQFKFKGDSLLVTDLIPESGAIKAGLLKGDKIIQLDSNELDEMYYYSDVITHLCGKKNTTVNVKLIRNKDTLNKKITRKPIPNYHFMVYGNSEHPEVSISDYKTAIQFMVALYPDSIKTSTISEHGIRYMLEQLDPHSTYISLEDIHDMNAPLKGSFTGVGVRFQIVKDTIIIVQAIPGGPSEKVGIQAGDKLVYIDSENVGGVGIKNSGVRDKLLGDKGTKVSVKIKRSIDDELLDFTIERDKIPIYSVDASYMAGPKVGYIKLNNFSASSIDEIKKAVYLLKAEGMKDLILDLQNNGGGYLMTAVELVDQFLSEPKVVVSTKGRSYPEKKFQTRYNGLLENGRLVVLVNESSASASEIVSGAIQDWDRGLIVGRRTFGKGLVQKPINLPDGTQARITTSKYYTPSGRCIQKPYEGGSIAYRKEKYERYMSGESFHADSIKFNKQEIFSTIINKRTVYGGGGIMPDFFVPLDTTGTSKYYSALIRKGIMNQFALLWVNNQRDKLESKYTTFNKFKTEFKTDKVVKELISYAEEEGLEFNQESYKKAENTINIRLKANIAQDLYDYKRFYEIINELNESLQKSIELLKDGKAFKNFTKS
jgi:carboxyl-terminal processing protease